MEKRKLINTPCGTLERYHVRAKPLASNFRYEFEREVRRPPAPVGPRAAGSESLNV